MGNLTAKIKASVEAIQDRKKQPYFRQGDILEVNSDLSMLDRVLSGQDKKFPFVWTQKNNDFEIVIPDKLYNASFELFIVNRSKQNYTSLEREANELPYLRLIQKTLLRSLELNGNIEILNPKIKEEFYNSNENIFKIPVNVIRISIENSNY